MHITLTAKGKIKILKDVLVIMQHNYNKGFYFFSLCELISSACSNYMEIHYTYTVMYEDFLLLNYKPENKLVIECWFPLTKKGAEKRIKIVNELIKHFENT